MHVLFSTFTDCDGDTLNRALVQYTFDKEEHAITLGPHGNAKKGSTYLRTLPSTLQKLRKVSQNLTPKFAVCEVSSAAGGIMSASSAASLPRNRQQVSNMRRRTEISSDPYTTKQKDPLFSVMVMCKNSEGRKTDESFVRIVTGAPEAMALLCPDWILNDLDRFCTGLPHTILTLDPTFDVGDFNVTVSTYRHLMLTNSAGSHPVMTGPIFIHQRKHFNSYYFFASSLLGLKPSLSSLCCFGTDGEKALFSAFQTVFNKAIHLRCFLHFRGNLDAKLKECNIPKSLRIEFLRDVFGNPSGFEDGLVDVDEDMYEASVSSLKEIWNNRELPFNNPPRFYDWFIANCKDAVKTTMLKSLRVAAGLGNPPQPYYTNDVECHNNVIKQQTNYRAQELPQFIDSMKRMIENQKKEVERAVVCMGEYKISLEFSELQIDARKFFQMSEAQREKVVKRFFAAKFKAITNEDTMNQTTRKTQSVECESPDDATELDNTIIHDSSESDSSKEECDNNPLLQLSSLPQYVAEKIWNESEQLAMSKNSVCISPGCNDGSAWLVQSNSQTRPRPFFVECKKNGRIVCEQSCMLFHSCNICAHTVAVAKQKYCLDSLLKSVAKKQKGVNLTRMSDVGMPKNRGKKPGTKRKASLKSSTKRLRSLTDEAGSENRKPRIRILPKKKPSSEPAPPLIRSISSTASSQSIGCTSVAASVLGSSSTISLHPATQVQLHPFHSPIPPPLFPSQTSTQPPPPLLQPHLQPVPSSVAHDSWQPSPSLINVPMQVSTPLFYAPLYLSGETQSPKKEEREDPFYLTFIRGNISRCTGCKMRNLRTPSGAPHPPPNDLCLQHKEFVVFENPHTGLHQLSHDLRNVYYHAHRQCVGEQAKIIVPSDVRARLNSIHMHHLMQEFGLNILNNTV